MMKRFEGILVKKENCVKRSNVKEEKKAERLSILVAATNKKLNLEEKKTNLKERRVELVAALKDTKVLTMRMEKLDDDAVMIVHTICVKMLKRLTPEMEASKKEASEKEPDGEEEAGAE